MAYILLSENEQDDILASFMLSQERDQFTHTVNQQRYDSLLTTLPRGPFFDRIQQLRDETSTRLGEVNAIIAGTAPQLPSVARLNAAIARLKGKGLL